MFATGLFVSMIALLAIRVPIAAAMFIPAALGYWYLTSDAALLGQLQYLVWARFSTYDLSVIPLFLLMGQFATQGGLSRALFGAARAFVGHLKGGLAMAAILAAGAFGAICGSSFATAATITQVALPEMRRYNFSDRLSTGTLAAGGTLGIVIPPSVPLAIYAILTEQSIAKMFAAAMLPGLLAIVGYLVVIMVNVRLNPGQATSLERYSGAERLKTLKDVWPVVLIFAIVFTGIYGGFFTPTEGAGIGAMSTFVLALLRRELSLAGFRDALLMTAKTTAMIYVVFLGADMMTVALAVTQTPAKLAEYVLALGWPPMLVLAIILSAYIILGCVMDELAMILLTLPIFFPLVMGLDLFGLEYEDKAIWFGILLLMVVQIGLLMPPVGLNVFIINSLSGGVPIGETYRGVVPYLVSDVVRTILLFLFPVLSLAGLALVR